MVETIVGILDHSNKNRRIRNPIQNTQKSKAVKNNLPDWVIFWGDFIGISH